MQKNVLLQLMGSKLVFVLLEDKNFNIDLFLIIICLDLIVTVHKICTWWRPSYLFTGRVRTIIAGLPCLFACKHELCVLISIQW